MKILMIETVSGINYTLTAGEVVDRPDAEAGRFIAAGIASVVPDEPSSRETATKPVRLRAAKE